MTDNQRKRAEFNKVHSDLKRSKELLRKLEANTNPKNKNKFQISNLKTKIHQLETLIRRFTNPWLEYRNGIYWMKLVKCDEPVCIGVTSMWHNEYSIHMRYMHFSTGEMLEEEYNVSLKDIEYLVPAEDEVGFS